MAFSAAYELVLITGYSGCHTQNAVQIFAANIILEMVIFTKKIK